MYGHIFSEDELFLLAETQDPVLDLRINKKNFFNNLVITFAELHIAGSPE